MIRDKPFLHFENLLYTFAMQYKIKVQGNIETVCLLFRKPSYNNYKTPFEARNSSFIS